MNARTEPVFTYTENYHPNEPIVQFAKLIKEKGWWFSRPGEEPVNILAPINNPPQLLEGPNMNLITASLAAALTQQPQEPEAVEQPVAALDVETLVIGDAPVSSNPEDTMAPLAADGETPTIKTNGVQDMKTLLALAEGLIATDPIAKAMFDKQMQGLDKLTLPMSKEEKERRDAAEMAKFKKRLEIRAHNQAVEVQANKRAKTKKLRRQGQANLEKAKAVVMTDAPNNPVIMHRLQMNEGLMFKTPEELGEDDFTSATIWDLHGHRVKGYPRDPVAYVNAAGQIWHSRGETWQQPPSDYLPLYLGARSFQEVNRVLEGITA